MKTVIEAQPEVPQITGAEEPTTVCVLAGLPTVAFVRAGS
jgi:hypothetical protein